MKTIIREVETFFINKINKIYYEDEIQDINVCCTYYEIVFLEKIARSLKKAFPNISDKDICIAIIYTYYGLNLGEQTTDYITPNIYKDYADDADAVFELYLLITTGDIIYHGENLSSKIRRFLQTGEII
jgi:hypothetical protein